MQKYQDTQLPESGVDSYEIGDGWIKIRFKKGGEYLYTNASAGALHICEMQRLAQFGNGLNSYINRHCRKSYESKL